MTKKEIIQQINCSIYGWQPLGASALVSELLKVKNYLELLEPDPPPADWDSLHCEDCPCWRSDMGFNALMGKLCTLRPGWEWKTPGSWCYQGRLIMSGKGRSE